MNINITGGVIQVDEQDLVLLEPYRWYVNTQGYVACSCPSLLLHRHILSAPKGMFVDHRDGDRLNNTRWNLRLATRSQNYWNRHARISSSGYLGVSYYKRDDTWEAQIMAHRKRYFLGRFSTPEEAAVARDIAAIRLHGEFANLNFTRSDYD